MFKIILADDEPIIIKGLRKLVDWEQLDARIVAEAGDGEELLQKIEACSPDIIICDVSMPNMTGLDVLKKVRETDRDVKFIFLSGYQEFDYVRTAIHYEAQEYLLKPAGREELRQAVLKAEQALKENSPLEKWREEKDDLQSVFRMINSEADSKELYGHFQEMGIRTEGVNFTGVCFSMPVDFYTKVQDQNMQELLRFSVFRKIQEILKKDRNGFVIKRDAGSSNLILLSPQEDGPEKVQEEIRAICDRVYREYDVRLVVGIGKTSGNIRELKYIYKTAKFCSELYYFTQENCIRYDEVDRDFKTSFEDYDSAYKELVSSFLSSGEDWQDKLDEALSVIENLHYGNRYAAENRCIVMVMNLYRDLEEYHILPPDKRPEYEEAVAAMRHQKSYEELRQYTARFLTAFLEEHAFQDAAAEHQTIHQVKEYIQQHYAENLSLRKMAEIVYMNPYYFSVFFKKETGENFKNYLAEVRMKEAVRLLMQTDMKTYELAKAVGYNDVRSFTEKFKEYYGDSPSGYKKAKRS